MKNVTEPNKLDNSIAEYMEQRIKEESRKIQGERMTEQKEDLINRPNHYCKFNVELESIDVVDLFSFNLGSCLKYAIRFRDKSNPVMDLEKALWYAKRIQRGFRKRDRAMKELEKNKAVLEIFAEKSKDIVTAETISFFIECHNTFSMKPIIELLEKRLDYCKVKCKDAPVSACNEG